ncbi:MAG: tetratricopeptide repeat protein [Candidatus Latescibacteria bacterium]|nr:tetratricopeptide repeat protein [Candidatus Latescibacterota bacterium]
MPPLQLDPFFQLAQQPDDQIDLGLGALLIARAANPAVDIPGQLAQLDAMAHSLEPRLELDAPRRTQLETLNHYLFAEQGFCGTDQADYYAPRNSYLDQVLTRKKGIPITLSVLYLEIGWRLGLPLAGVNFPLHFLVRCDRSDAAPLFIDPFSGGRIFQRRQLEARMPDLDEAFLNPVSPRLILVRMLNNLEQIHTNSQDFVQAQAMVQRKTWLLPHDPQSFRILGLLCCQTGSHQLALEALEHYLSLATNPVDADQIKAQIHALSVRLGRYN